VQMILSATSAVLCSLLTELAGGGAELACTASGTAGGLLLTPWQTACCVVALPIAAYIQARQGTCVVTLRLSLFSLLERLPSSDVMFQICVCGIMRYFTVFIVGCF